MGLIAPERGRRRGARGGIEGGACPELKHRVGECNGSSRFSQPEKIFHAANCSDPIKLSINYFNPQIKDSTKCLMSVC